MGGRWQDHAGYRTADGRVGGDRRLAETTAQAVAKGALLNMIFQRGPDGSRQPARLIATGGNPLLELRGVNRDDTIVRE